jgi:hypothetical protein
MCALAMNAHANAQEEQGETVTAETPTAGAAPSVPPPGPPPAPPPASNGTPLRGDARIVGFISTPFGGNLDGTGAGFGIAANFGWGKIPLTFGIDVMTAYFGSSTSVENYQTGDTVTTVRRDRTDKDYFLDLSVRLQPIDWWARPYLEGVAGTKLLETDYNLSIIDTDTTTSTQSDHDWAGSIGWGAGLDLGGTQTHAIGFTLGVRRLNGATASFSRTLDMSNTAVHYTSPTSTTFWMMGVLGCFGGSANP